MALQALPPSPLKQPRLQSWLGCGVMEFGAGPGGFQEHVQLLVQDSSFITAVRDGALHSAAIAAVRLLKPNLVGPEFKRPADRRSGLPEGTGLDGAATRQHAAAGPAANLALQRQLSDPRLREMMRCMRMEALTLEDMIPWNSVRRTWRNKRSNWRRQVKSGGELVPDLAARLKELRAALLTDDTGFAGCGHTWRVQLEACIHGRGSHHSLLSVWEELKASIRAWLDIRDRPLQAVAGGAAAEGSMPQLQAEGVRAIKALQTAAAFACEADCGAERDGDGDGSGAMLQVPLEGILNHSREALLAVQHAIDCERQALLAAQQQQQQQQQGGEPLLATQPLVSYFSSINAGWEDSASFDSGADTDCGGSDATDMDSDFD